MSERITVYEYCCFGLAHFGHTFCNNTCLRVVFLFICFLASFATLLVILPNDYFSIARFFCYIWVSMELLGEHNGEQDLPR